MSVVNSRLARLYETTRHLTAEQWLFRAVCRGQRVVRTMRPAASYEFITKRAERLPLPDLSHSQSGREVAELVSLLQRAVHGPFVGDIERGAFTLLNRRVDFGSVEGVRWRQDLGEDNNPLWRMNLAYFGWAVELARVDLAKAIPIVLALLRSLDDQNDFSQPGVFRDVWNAYTASHRCINLLTILAFAAGSHHLSPQSEAYIARHARFCAAFVRHSLERDLQYNHLLKNYVALAVFASMCRAWPSPLDFLSRRVIQSLDQQILSDGGHAERAPMYHALSLLDVRVLAACFRAHNSEVTNRLVALGGKMTQALELMSHPDGDVALFNDSWLGEAPAAQSLIGPTAQDKEGTLPVTGYSRLVASPGSALVFDHGPCGPDDNPGHAHADFLSVEVSMGRNRFVVDPGVPTYTRGELRNLSRSSQMHNGPAICGTEPIEFWESFRVGRRGTATLLDVEIDGPTSQVSGLQTGLRVSGVDVARWCGAWPTGFAIVDIWSKLDLERSGTRWLIDGGWAADGEAYFRKGGEIASVEVVLGERSRESPAAYWPRFGAESPACAIELKPVAMENFAVAALWFGVDGAAAQLTQSQAQEVAIALRRRCMSRPRAHRT